MPPDIPPALGSSPDESAQWSEWRASSLQLDDLEGVELLRETLLGGEYTPDGFLRVLRARSNVRDSDETILEALLRLPERDTTSTLVRLFHLGAAADADAAAAALAPMPLERLAAMGVLRERDGEVEPLVDIFPIADVFVVSDTYRVAPNHHDHVAPVATGTVALAALTVRRPIDAALDLGSGSGFHAMLMAKHARRVVAVDINPRATRYAAFNALLNGLPNVEVREGDLFEPVEGETFDLITCNPPYVISPDTRYVFQDSGLRGDAFAAGLVKSLPQYLTEDGYAHVLAEWLVMPGEDSFTAPRSWVEGNGVDAIVFAFSTQRPVDYALLWNRPIRSDAEAYADAVDRWRTHFDHLGAKEVGWGAIAMRRRSGDNWVATRLLELPEPLDPAHRQLERMFTAEDFLAGRDDDALLDAPFVVPEDVVLDAQFALVEGRRLVRRAAFHQQGALGVRFRLDEFTLELFSRLDGRTPLREIATGLGAEGRDPEELTAAAAGAARELLALGLIVPA